MSRLESVFGRVCKKWKIRGRAGKIKVVSNLRNGNVSGIYGSLNSELLDEVGCVMLSGSHVVVGGGERIGCELRSKVTQVP